MTIISYAQNHEDIMLWRALKHVNQGFYIDVGAAWPTQHSVTKLFYERGWRGINIEPNPDLFNLLKSDRLYDTNLQIALSDNEGEQIMHFIESTGLSTLRSEVAKTHQKDGWEIISCPVELSTLTTIWKRYVRNREVHFLKIDVEGFERKVILGNNWSIYRPWIVVVESTQPLSSKENHFEWESDLVSAEYKLIYKDGLNRYYLADEHLDLSKAFEYPPNIFDNFKSAEEIEIRFLLESKICAAENRANIAENRVNDVLSSISWRITKPLRKLGIFMQEIFSNSPSLIKNIDNRIFCLSQSKKVPTKTSFFGENFKKRIFNSLSYLLRR